MEINITLLVQLFILMSLYMWLSRVLFTPLMQLAQEREKRILGARRKAAELDAQTEKKLLEMEQQMSCAKTEGLQVVADFKKQGDQLARVMEQEARNEARERLEQARLEMEQHKGHIVDTLFQEIPQWVQKISQRIEDETHES